MDANSTGTVSPETTGLSVRDAASAFESLLSPLEDKEDGAEATPALTEEEAAARPAELEAEATETEDEEAEEPTEDEESESDDESPQKQPADQAFTVRVDGKEEQVPLSELLAGYSRQSDYTRKTQALSTDRKAFEQEQVGVRQERAEYANLLPKLRATLENAAGAEPDWAKIRSETPDKFAEQWALWQQSNARIAQVKAEEARTQGAQAAEAQAAMKKYMGEQRNELIKKLPEWKEPAKAKAASEAIQKVMRSVGFGDDELTVTDHRALMIAHMAAKWAEVEASRPGLRKKQEAARVVKPGGGSVQPKSKTDQARTRFNRSGSTKDLAGYFETLDNL
jgi:hypothetical protein